MPERINHVDEAEYLSTVRSTSEAGKYHFSWMNDYLRQALCTPCSWIGGYLRDQMYFPLNQPDAAQRSSMQFAEQLRNLITRDAVAPQTGVFPNLEKVRQAFTINTLPIHIQSDGIAYTFYVDVVESTPEYERDGKGLRLFLFSYYGNKATENEERGPWLPDTIKELGIATILVLKALHEQGFPMESLDLFSLGTVVFEGLQYLNHGDSEIIPSKIILDRGFSSTYKVATMLFSFPMRWIMYFCAYMSNWMADPEAGFMNYCNSHATLRGRTLVNITAFEDAYFSGTGAWEPTFLPELRAAEMEVFSGEFMASGYHNRAHHALPRGVLCNNAESGSNLGDFVPMHPLETVASALMREFHLSGESESGFHNSLVIGGNAETKEIVLLRMYSTLEAFVNS